MPPTTPRPTQKVWILSFHCNNDWFGVDLYHGIIGVYKDLEEAAAYGEGIIDDTQNEVDPPTAHTEEDEEEDFARDWKYENVRDEQGFQCEITYRGEQRLWVEAREWTVEGKERENRIVAGSHVDEPD